MSAYEQSSPARKREHEEEEVADGDAAKKRPRADESEGASVLGLANYTEEGGPNSGGPREEEVEDGVDEDEEEEENERRRAPERRPRQIELRRDCPYLDIVKRQVITSIFILCFLLNGEKASSATATSADSMERWGYVEVRHKAHLFWWFYKSPQRVSSPAKPWPTVLWLQGGPGGSGVGGGNFMGVGPLDANLKPRNSTWLQKADLIFVDLPVGVGFSYVEDPSLLARTDSEVVADATELLKALTVEIPTLQTSPLFVVGESYGGKLATMIGISVARAIHAGTLKLNLGGVALGDSWISPGDFALSYAQLLHAVSRLDENTVTPANKIAATVNEEIAAGQFAKAHATWVKLVNLIDSKSSSVNWENYMLDSTLTTQSGRKTIGDIMNGVVKRKLKIIPKDVVSLRIWRDPWIPRDYRHLPTTNQGWCRYRWVSDLLHVDGTWNTQRLQQYFNREDQVEILKICPSNRNADDFLAWHPDKRGMFSVKSAYRLALNMHMQEQDRGALSANPDGERTCWKMIWSCPVPPKVKMLAWKLGKNALTTRSNLKKRCIVKSNLCPICGLEEEDSFHAFITCPHARNLWLAMREEWPLPADDQLKHTGTEWLLQLLSVLTEYQRACTLLLLWRIWHSHNEMTHEKPCPPIEGSWRFLLANSGASGQRRTRQHFHEASNQRG